jgi:hypothetical protein
VRQEVTEPETGPKIISEVRFNDDVISGKLLLPLPTMNVTFFERQKTQVFVGMVFMIFLFYVSSQ